MASVSDRAIAAVALMWLRHGDLTRRHTITGAIIGAMDLSVTRTEYVALWRRAGARTSQCIVRAAQIVGEPS